MVQASACQGCGCHFYAERRNFQARMTDVINANVLFATAELPIVKFILELVSILLLE